jgi:hypothetical protein
METTTNLSCILAVTFIIITMTVPSKSTINHSNGVGIGAGGTKLRVRGRSPPIVHSSLLESLLRTFVVVAGIIVIYNGYNSYEEGEFSSTTTSTISVSSIASSSQTSRITTTIQEGKQNLQQEEEEEEEEGSDEHDDEPTHTAYRLPKSKYHTVFSTGCSTFQDWQSYVFFYHAMQSGQEGHVTRIASGCTGTDLRDIHSIFDEEIKSMSPNHHLHLTPEYSLVHLDETSKKKGGRGFKYFNKPFGMRHWMQHALGYPHNHAEHDDSIVILLDPDQILLRPFTDDFSNSSEKYRTKDHKLKVEHGSPFAQQYGYGLQWKNKVDLNHVFDGQPTPVSNLTSKEAADYYMAMGPPYIATAKDMWSIVSKWTEIVPRVHEDYPHLLVRLLHC